MTDPERNKAHVTAHKSNVEEERTSDSSSTLFIDFTSDLLTQNDPAVSNFESEELEKERESASEDISPYSSSDCVPEKLVNVFYNENDHLTAEETVVISDFKTGRNKPINICASKLRNMSDSLLDKLYCGDEAVKPGGIALKEEYLDDECRSRDSASGPNIFSDNKSISNESEILDDFRSEDCDEELLCANKEDSTQVKTDDKWLSVCDAEPSNLPIININSDNITIPLKRASASLSCSPDSAEQSKMYKLSKVESKNITEERNDNLNEERYMEIMKNIYILVVNHYKKENRKWIYSQFKWAWLDCYFRLIISTKFLENRSNMIYEEIIEQIRVRKEREYSILRRIVEGDDIPARYMVLLVLGIEGTLIEVFDGYFSIMCEVDLIIHNKIKEGKLRIGSTIRISGCSNLLPGPVDFFSLDLSIPVLKINFNGYSVVNGINYRLGIQKKAIFLKKIKNIDRNGGIVPCIEFEVKRIIEQKIFIKFGNYKKVVNLDKYDAELEKINDMIATAGPVEHEEELISRKYTKMWVKDDTGECGITWWAPEEVKVKDKYRFIFLKVDTFYKMLYLISSSQTFVKKL